MARLIPALVAFLLAACSATPVGAPPPTGAPPPAGIESPSGRAVLCGPRRTLAARLARDYAERPVSMGLTGDGLMLEVFAGDRETFTILLTRPDGLSCILAAGEAWRGPLPHDEGEGT